MAARLGEVRLVLSEVQLEKQRAEQALRRETEAKQRIEKQVQGYKDMNETLHEALSIAAHNAAEHRLTADDGEAFLKDLDGADAEADTDAAGDADDDSRAYDAARAVAARKFEVQADGSFKET